MNIHFKLILLTATCLARCAFIFKNKKKHRHLGTFIVSLHSDNAERRSLGYENVTLLFSPHSHFLWVISRCWKTTCCSSVCHGRTLSWVSIHTMSCLPLGPNAWRGSSDSGRLKRLRRKSETAQRLGTSQRAWNIMRRLVEGYKVNSLYQDDKWSQGWCVKN